MSVSYLLSFCFFGELSSSRAIYSHTGLALIPPLILSQIYSNLTALPYTRTYLYPYLPLEKLTFVRSFVRFFLQISNFNWPGLGPASERRSAPTGRNGGRPRRCPSPGQLKFEILKLRIESSENGPKRSKNGPKTVRKRSGNDRNGPTTM